MEDLADKTSEVFKQLKELIIEEVSATVMDVITYFFPKAGFDISCKLSPMKTICMKCQNLFSRGKKGWLGEAKVSCILCHGGVQLILAYSWPRPAVLAAGKGRGALLFLLFLHFHSFSSFSPVPSLSSPLLSLLSLFSLSVGDDTK